MIRMIVKRRDRMDKPVVAMVVVAVFFNERIAYLYCKKTIEKRIRTERSCFKKTIVKRMK